MCIEQSSLAMPFKKSYENECDKSALLDKKENKKQLQPMSNNSVEISRTKKLVQIVHGFYANQWLLISPNVMQPNGMNTEHRILTTQNETHTHTHTRQMCAKHEQLTRVLFVVPM